MNQVIIDVREPDEFQSEYIEGSINIPLSEFERQGMPIIKQLIGKPILIMCQSGRRAEIAVAIIKKTNAQINAEVFSGGILKWKEQGNSIVSGSGKKIPLFRQVFIAAGLMVLVGGWAVFSFGSSFIFIPVLVGAGLTMAGLTGFCPMAIVLSKMPWNRLRIRTG